MIAIVFTHFEYLGDQTVDHFGQISQLENLRNLVEDLFDCVLFELHKNFFDFNIFNQLFLFQNLVHIGLVVLELLLNLTFFSCFTVSIYVWLNHYVLGVRA